MSEFLGQHFLKNKSAIRKMIAALDLHGGETVIEIGPGKGALTFPIVHECNRVGAKFLAIEKDRDLALEIFQSEEKIRVELGDALEILTTVTENLRNYKIVGNIPYYITGKLLRTISELENKPELTVLMIQKEVADRACAKQGDMNLLAAATQIWAEPEILFTLSPEDFDPPPKVSSAVIKLESEIQNLESEKIGNYYRLVHIIFKQPRKTLYNNLRDGLDLPEEKIKKTMEDLKIELKSRPQDLSIEQILSLSEKLS